MISQAICYSQTDGSFPAPQSRIRRLTSEVWIGHYWRVVITDVGELLSFLSLWRDEYIVHNGMVAEESW